MNVLFLSLSSFIILFLLAAPITVRFVSYKYILTMSSKFFLEKEKYLGYGEY